MKLKKTISGIIVICLMVLFASCDAASILKMGGMMGKTESNIYGLKPNMAAVEEVAGVVSASVTKDESGNIKVDLKEAAKVQDTVADIKTSPQKMEELRKEMKKPVATTDEDHAKVKIELEGKKAEVVNDATGVINGISDGAVPEEVKKALTQVVENIGAITVSDKPTQAELVSVAVVTDLAETLKTTITEAAEGGAELNEEALVEVYNKAVGAVETIKTVNDNEFDLLQGIDIAGLLGMAGGGAKGLEDLDEPQKTMATDAINSLLAAIDGDGDGEITKAEFQSFVGYMSFIRTAYETGAYAFRPFEFSINNADLKHGFKDVDGFLKRDAARQDFTINDIPLYLVAVLLTEGENLIKAVNPAIDDLNAYLANEIKGKTPLDDDAIVGNGLNKLIPHLPYDSLYDVLKLGDADKIVEAFEGFEEVFAPELTEEVSARIKAIGGDEMVGLLSGALDEASGNLPKAALGKYAGVANPEDAAEVGKGMFKVELKIAHILNTAIVMAREASFAQPIMEMTMSEGERHEGERKFDDVIDGWFQSIEDGI